MLRDIVFTSRNNPQKALKSAWPTAKLIFLLGPAGTGKTHAALSMAIHELLADTKDRSTKELWLSRPMIPCDGEEIGYLPGDLDEKFRPWLGPFMDVLTKIPKNDGTEMKVADVNGIFKSGHVHVVPIAFLRGRTVSNANLLIDEAQNMTYQQIKCAATRVGSKGRVVLMGDPEQSDRYPPNDTPFQDVADALRDLNGVRVIEFSHADQVREPFITEVLRRLE